jgi:2'-5' RNA ligase
VGSRDRLDAAALGRVAGRSVPLVNVQLVVPPPSASEIDALRRAAGVNVNVGLPHCTLLPPQEVPGDQWAQALAVAWRVATEAAPFTIVVRGVAHMGARGTLYLRIVENADALHLLHRALTIPPFRANPRHPYLPHVTIAEGIAPSDAALWIDLLADYSVSISFERLHVRTKPEDESWRTTAELPFGDSPYGASWSRATATRRVSTPSTLPSRSP